MGKSCGSLGVLSEKIAHVGISRIERMLGQGFPGGQVDRVAHRMTLAERLAQVKAF